METGEMETIIGDKKYRGLTTAEALSRLNVYGPNARRSKKKHWWLKRLWDVFSEPMMLLILATAVVYLFIGERIEAIIFFCSIIPIGLMDYFQQQRTDRAVAELDKMLEESCKVYRDGKLITESVKNLVPGDLVHLVAGDKIPADGFISSGHGLNIDESVLTGESVPVIKNVLPSISALTNSFRLFQGTLAIAGEVEFVVVNTGDKTEYGQIGTMLEKIIKEKTPLQKKITRLIRLVAVVAAAAAIMVGILLAFLRDWKEGVLGGLTMGMALIPEEFPIVFSVFLVMGVWRLARKNSLVRQMTTVETLGAATVICTDKTGTLTEGRMSLTKFYFGSTLCDAKDKKNVTPLRAIAEQAVLSLERTATDPMEIEMQRVAVELGIDLEKYFENFELLEDSPFDANTKMVHHVWKDKQSNAVSQHSVGAPESIIDACDLSDAERKHLLQVNEDLAAGGLRVIALAGKDLAGGSVVQKSGLSFIGLLALNDPPRPEAGRAIAICQEAGIRVIMITGDNKLTAHHIAEKIGLRHSDDILSGDEIAKMSPAALRLAVTKHDIFSRVHPEHKYAIIDALKQNGEVVAMTGDGVNDAPALKKADIGVAMGKKGTEVAREAADMILLDDNFFTIARAVKEGRKIYRNMQQAFIFLLSFHLPIVGLAIFPVLLGEPLIFIPIQIIFLELICDPVSVIGFEKEKAPRNVMRVPPRSMNESLIPPKLWRQVVVQALAIFAICIAFYFYYSHGLSDLEMARAMAFGALVASQTWLVFFTREWYQIRHNFVLTGIGVATIVALFMIFYLPQMRYLFHFPPVSLSQFFLLLGVTFVFIGIVGTLTKRALKQ